MATIDVDFEVFKELTVRRRSEEMSENDVLRELLGLTKPSRDALRASTTNGGAAWVSKGVAFPHGTEFRATYKGQIHTAVVKDGALVLNGKRFSSPSAAAISITGNPVNGWRFWECSLPGSFKWRVAADFR